MASFNGKGVRYFGGNGITLLTGHWHLPPDKDSGIVIIMAHGMGLTQTFGLDPYIKAFTNAGLNVFTFDYATFGQSDGLPRHQIHPHRHVADLEATINLIQTQNSSTITKIGLWGTSLGGGHVLEVAAKNRPNINAVISQVGHMASGFEAVFFGGSLTAKTLQSLLLFLVGFSKWFVCLVLNKSCYYPIVGRPGSPAMLQNPGDDKGYLDLVPSDLKYGWENAATTGSALQVLTYRPLTVVSKIMTAPVLLIGASRDTLCPLKYIRKAKEQIRNAELLVMREAGHFDVYHNATILEETIRAQVEFYQKHLMLP
eukprot:CAMPEP_0194226334 /NCGR_PEP_ID=MMETSP0156-20130528/41643_1 /TAXON_ID=33649 /ORGANISM="Thalassionema nitzschioides, Strain L26-B" /LENGTH=312 /DNA_ID=CAMNT_0038958659 /DNA_START=189 /DNA_END=1128 /DNA_ORIENTATION=+